MPHSDAQGKDTALAWYQRIKPKTVVDIGAGAGTYAALMRTPHDPARWTAIEAWEPYVDKFDLHSLYDEIITCDARHLPWTHYRADLVIAGDVLEHTTRDDAKALLRRIRQGATHLIVSIPVLHLPQGAVGGNPYERHIDHWTAGSMRNELETYGTIRDEWIGDVLAYYWWTRADTQG